MFKESDFNTKFGKDTFRKNFGLYISEDEAEEQQGVEDTRPSVAVQAKPFQSTEVAEEPVVQPQNPFAEVAPQPAVTPPQSRAITPYTITRHLRNSNVVGEEAIGSLVTIAVANGMHVILEGGSGSGKTHVMNNILKLFDQDNIYELGLASGQAVWHQADVINASSIIYIPELQKAMAGSAKVSSILEFIKSLTEGKDATRIATNNRRDGADVYTIESGKTIVSTIAKENNFKYDRETQRRFLILQTDDSKEHIEDIIEDKVARRMSIDVSDSKAIIEKSLADRVKYVMGLQDTYVLNPFIGYLQQAFPVSNKTQAYMDHYLNLFDAWGKFFSPERETIEVGGNTFVLLNLEDAYNVFEMYNPHFMQTLDSFNQGSKVTRFSPDWGACLEHGMQAVAEDLSVRLDQGILHIGQDYPAVVEQWINRQLTGTKAHTTDYKTGDTIEIADLARSYQINSGSPQADALRTLPGPGDEHEIPKTV